MGMERFITFETPRLKGRQKPKAWGLRRPTEELFTKKKTRKKSKAQKGKGFKKFKMSNDKYQWSPYIKSFLKFIVHLIRVLEQFLSASTLGSFEYHRNFWFQKVLQCLAASGSFTPPGRSPKKEIIIQLKASDFWPPKMEKKNSINLVPGRWPPNNFKIQLRRRFCAAFRFKTTN